MRMRTPQLEQNAAYARETPDWGFPLYFCASLLMGQQLYCCLGTGADVSVVKLGLTRDPDHKSICTQITQFSLLYIFSFEKRYQVILKITHNVEIMQTTWTVACRLFRLLCFRLFLHCITYCLAKDKFLTTAHYFRLALLTVAQSTCSVRLPSATLTSSVSFIRFPHKA